VVGDSGYLDFTVGIAESAEKIMAEKEDDEWDE
jgi:hypothetical protein